MPSTAVPGLARANDNRPGHSEAFQLTTRLGVDTEPLATATAGAESVGWLMCSRVGTQPKITLVFLKISS